jgi:transposase
MKKTHGRTPSFSKAVMRIIADKTHAGLLTQREAARFYDVSHGAISAWKLKFKNETPSAAVNLERKPLSAKQTETRKQVRVDLVKMMSTLDELDAEIRLIRSYQQKLFSK